MKAATPLATNIALWSGLGAATLMIVSAWNNVPELVTAPMWRSVFADAGVGITVAGTIAAAGAAVAVSTSRRWQAASELRPARASMVVLVQRVWPAWAGLLIGYVANVALLAGFTTSVLETPLQWNGQSWWILAASVASLLSPVVFGTLVGIAMPGMVAGPVTLVLGLMLSALGFMGGAFTWLGVASGSWIPLRARGLSDALHPALLSTPLIALAAALGLLIATQARRAVYRVGFTILFAVAGMTAATTGSGTVDSSGVVARSPSALRCDGGMPALCLWPEIESEREILGTYVSDFTRRLSHSGLGVPTTVTPVPADERSITFDPQSGAVEADAASLLAGSYTYSIACLSADGTTATRVGAPVNGSEFLEMYRAEAAFAIALGANAESAASRADWNRESGIDPLEYLGVADENEAMQRFVDWAAARPTKCGAASGA